MNVSGSPTGNLARGNLPAVLTATTSRFELRAIGAGAVDERMVGWLSDPEIVNEGVFPEISTVDRCRAWVSHVVNAGNLMVGVYERNRGILVGFFVVILDRHNNIARTLVCLGERRLWGTGAVRECRAALIDGLFDGLGVAKVWGQVNTRNLPMVFNYVAQGFVLEAIAREHAVTREGKRVDQYFFGLLPEEWRAARQATVPE